MNAARTNNSAMFGRTTRGASLRAFPTAAVATSSSSSASVFSKLTPTSTTVVAGASSTPRAATAFVNSGKRCMSSAAFQSSSRIAARNNSARYGTGGLFKQGFPATLVWAPSSSMSQLQHIDRGIASLLFQKGPFGENISRNNARDPMTVAMHVEAAYQKGKKYHYGWGVEPNLETAFESYQQAAYEGHAESCCALASMYLKGEVHGWVDYEKARQLYSIAASVGHAPAQFKLGEMYESGMGVGVDLLKAQQYYIDASKRDYAPALCNLGTMYAEGDGVEYDPVRAVKLLQAAADQGLADALCCLGLMYLNGEGVEADEALAEEYYMRAAEQGHALAQVNLGHLYYNQDNAEMAKECWELAARQGVALALCNLGAMYMTGQGVPQSYNKAYEYYSVAAHKGDFEAQYQLGVLYEHGHVSSTDVQQRQSTALSWFNKAAQQGHTEAKECVLRLQSLVRPSLKTKPTSSTPQTDQIIRSTADSLKERM